MSTLGDATLYLRTDQSGLNQGLQNAEKRVESAFKAMAAKSRQAGMALTAFGAPLAGAIGASVSVFAGFEQKMANVEAVSGATSEQFARMNEVAKQMGQSTVFTAGQSAEALQFMAMAGMAAEESIGALPDVLNLAAAGQLELGQSADIVTNIMAGFGIQSEEVTKATDVLVTGFTSANTDLVQLGEAFKYSGPVAKAAGLSFEESSAALSLLGNAGLQASMAGTGLRGIITRLLSPTNEAADVLARLGVVATDSSGEMLPLENIMRQFEDSGLSAADAMTIFGQRAGPSMLALLEQGSGALQGLTKDMEDSAGTADRVAKTQLDTFNGQVTLLKSALEGVALAIGAAVTPALRSLVEQVTPVLQSIAKWVENNPQLAKTIFLVVGAVGALSVAIGAALMAVGFLGPAFAVLLGPIGLVALAIGGLVAVGVAVVANWEWVKLTAYRLWYQIGDVVETAVNIIIDIINLMTWHIRKTFATIVDVADAVAGAFGVELPAAVKDFADAVDAGIPPVELFDKESVALKITMMETGRVMEEIPTYMDDMVAGYEALAEAAERARRQADLESLLRRERQEQYKGGSEYEDALGGMTGRTQGNFEGLVANSEGQLDRLADVTKAFRRAEEDAERRWNQDRADAAADYSERLLAINESEREELIATRRRHEEEARRLMERQGEERADLARDHAIALAGLAERRNDAIVKLDRDLADAMEQARARYDKSVEDSRSRLERDSIKSGLKLASQLKDIDQDLYRSQQDALRDHLDTMSGIRADYDRRQQDAALSEKRKLEDIELDYERSVEEGQRRLADQFGVSFAEFISGVTTGADTGWVQENKRLVEGLRRDRAEGEQDAEIERARAEYDAQVDRQRAEQDARTAHQEKLAEIGERARQRREEAEAAHVGRLDTLEREHGWRLADIRLERQRTETEAEALHREQIESARAEYRTSREEMEQIHADEMMAINLRHNEEQTVQQGEHAAQLAAIDAEYDGKRAEALTTHRDNLAEIDERFDRAAENREIAHGRRMADLAEEWAGKMTARVQQELDRVTGLTPATSARMHHQQDRYSYQDDDLGFGGMLGDGVRGFAAGGIVRRPTFGMVGEAGPEAVLPLRNLDLGRGRAGAGVGPELVVNVENVYGFDDFAQQVNRAVLLYNRRGRVEAFF